MGKRDIMDNQEMFAINKDIIKGSRRSSNYFWIIILYTGGLGFFLAGLSSYFKRNLIPFTDVSDLIFIPQGILLLFYGTVAILVSTFILLTVIWDVGGGYNEYNKQEQLVRIVRKGFPGKNREIFLVYPFEDIKTIKTYFGIVFKVVPNRSDNTIMVSCFGTGFTNFSRSVR